MPFIFTASDCFWIKLPFFHPQDTGVLLSITVCLCSHFYLWDIWVHLKVILASSACSCSNNLSGLTSLQTACVFLIRTIMCLALAKSLKHRQKGSIQGCIHTLSCKRVRNCRESLGKYRAICIKAEMWECMQMTSWLCCYALWDDYDEPMNTLHMD